jgi:sugar lactone lactonase YvrE
VSEVTPFASGLHLAESPRWHGGRLWISDMWDHKVWSFGADGERELAWQCAPSEDPGGLGWLPDGSLVVVGMEGRCLYRIVDGQAEVYADLTALAPWQCNDMAIAPNGTAYVSQFGWDMWGGGSYALTTLLGVDTEGHVRAVADELSTPNGISIRDDGRSLVVAESGGFRLSSYTVGADGALAELATYAEVPAVEEVGIAPPDGICSDTAGAVWVAEPLGRRVLRIERGGAVTHTFEFVHHPLAVCLGGDDRRTLFVCLAGQRDKSTRTPEALASIVSLRVETPGAGVP